VLAKRLSPGLPPGIVGIVYTAGHPNDAVKTFLRFCVEAGARIFHYGDLDPDGLLIAQEIAAILTVAVAPWNMSVELHRRYAAYGYARLSLVRLCRPHEILWRNARLFQDGAQRTLGHIAGVIWNRCPPASCRIPPDLVASLRVAVK